MKKIGCLSRGSCAPQIALQHEIQETINQVDEMRSACDSIQMRCYIKKNMFPLEDPINTMVDDLKKSLSPLLSSTFIMRDLRNRSSLLSADRIKIRGSLMRITILLDSSCVTLDNHRG